MGYASKSLRLYLIQMNVLQILAVKPLVRYTSSMDEKGGNAGFQYNESGSDDAAPVLTQPTPPSPQADISWQASEFIDHQKTPGWFLLLILGAVFGAGLMYLITRSIFSTTIVVLAVIAFGMSAKQKPRTLTYTIGATSLQVGEKKYQYDDFRTFSILQEGALYSIFLEPIKRFMPPVSIYFDPNDGEKIFDVLASHIPHAERRPDAIDNLMRRIRF